jgi:hypothetical protein
MNNRNHRTLGYSVYVYGNFLHDHALLDREMRNADTHAFLTFERWCFHIFVQTSKMIDM